MTKQDTAHSGLTQADAVTIAEADRSHHDRVPEGGRARLDVDKTPLDQQPSILSATKPVANQGTTEADPTIRTEEDARNAHGGDVPL